MNASLRLFFALFLGLFASGGFAAETRTRPNILLITVDDMNCDSVGAFGCRLEGTTPRIDRLASEGLRFEYAHVVVGNCMPSRNVMWSGRYPHNNHVEGFYQVKDAKYPVLADLMKQQGYFTAIRGKVSHSTPYQPYAWDLVLDVIDGEKLHTKNVRSYYRAAKRGIAASREAGKPFCLMINVSDPHKPFYALNNRGEVVKDPNKPSRAFTPEEVPIPGFLFDDPDVRLELAHYYSSVRRADDCVGEVLDALVESGQAASTLVLFLSDHGMPLPFAKTQVYHHSTRTPLIIRWPGLVKPGSIDKQHMVSTVDFLPTLLDVVGADHPQGMDGRSFYPLLKGEAQTGREMVFKEYNENAGGNRHPMRSVETKKFGYIFNPWSDGNRVFRTATQGTLTYRKMKQLAKTDEKMAARLELFDHRVPEEFYDYERDPDARHNLIDDPAYKDELNKLRKELLAWMERTGDPMLECFRHRDDPQALKAYMTKDEQEAAGRRKNKAKRNPQQRARRNAKFIQLEIPKSIAAGETIEVSVPHTIPKRLGEQLIHVTLKDGNSKRISREVLKASGDGTAKAKFQVPADVPGGEVEFAAFIGEDFPNHLQHIKAGPVELKR